MATHGAADEFEFATLGSVLTIEVDGACLGRCRVVGRDGRRFEVTPLAPPDLANVIPAARSVSLGFVAPDALYTWNARVFDRLTPRRFSLIADDLTPTRVQRREFFRLPVRFPILLCRPDPQGNQFLAEGVPYLPPREDGTDYRILRTIDVSGGGCLCAGSEEWMREGYTYDGHLYLGDGQPPLAVRMALLRVFGEGRAQQSAFQFVELRERRRERILRALFREYRRQRGKLEPPQPVSS